MAANKRLRFRLSTVISRVFLISLRRARRVKSKRKLSDSVHPLEAEAANLINPAQGGKRKTSAKGRMLCCAHKEAVQENCHRVVAPPPPPPSPTRSNRPKPPPKVSCGSPDDWEREKVWNVIAEVDNKLVKKRVVLKKKRSRKCPSPSPPRAPMSSEVSSEVENYPGSSKERRGGGTFRLSTSSGDASMGPESLAWDREHPLFTSDDSSGPGSARVHHVTFSEVDDMGFHHTRSSKGGGGGGYFTSSTSCCGGSLPDLGYNARRRRSSVSSRKEEELSLLSSASRDQTLHVLESSSKRWQSTGSGSGSLRSSSDRGSDVENGHRTRRAAEGGPRNKQRLPSAVRGKVRESFPVHVVTRDPYHEFRQSMIQMIFEKKLNRTSDLEELLECYLYLNPPAFHEVIVQVFTDLWLQQTLGETEGGGGGAEMVNGGGGGGFETVARGAARSLKHACRNV